MDHAPSPAPLLALAAVLMAYLAAARAQRRAGRRWAGGRTAAFAGGVALLALAAAPPLAAWAHGDLRGHMVQHVLVGMLAPLGLVLGAPVALALRTLPVPAARRVTRFLRGRVVRVVSHPATAAVLNVGGMAVLYLTPLYAATLHAPALHALVHLHVLAAGVLFTWAVLAGPDPAPHPAPLATRLGVLTLAIAAHAVLGKLMYGYGWPCGVAGAAEVQAAAQVMYYGGDLAEGLLLVALFARWYRAGRTAGGGAAAGGGVAARARRAPQDLRRVRG
ncbi:cytochrome c oxidase assembly protein [Rubrivirga sp. S365]|uniref:Cytochrome c oxidase assembly protein n=1 Tax=Rubrivirga litoralis TaxID=3075598 RepID=A0ABU3BT19_9BACT|nr:MULTISPECIES: cytochrome c oxidase assembly protein [unclassified Rubrivirga]MDT0632434.1 cytochrome c oxidase assembly protein [Rubrivirga sp. F394]MDT7857081.1 cytochrome c oxidase assembly protein [Rubrivirga sp. S365]